MVVLFVDRGLFFKVILLGEVGVGKIVIFYCFKDNIFEEWRKIIVGIDSFFFYVKVGD